MSPAAGRRRLAQHAQGKVFSVSATRVQTPLYADCSNETGSNWHSFRRGVSAADTIGCALSKNQLASCVRYSTDGRQQNVKNRTQRMWRCSKSRHYMSMSASWISPRGQCRHTPSPNHVHDHDLIAHQRLHV